MLVYNIICLYIQFYVSFLDTAPQLGAEAIAHRVRHLLTLNAETQVYFIASQRFPKAV